MDLYATNNQTFVWTVSLAQWALLFDLTTARFQMRIAKKGDRNTALQFDSVPGAQGTCAFQSASKLLTMRAPVAQARRVVPAEYIFGLVATINVPSANDPFVKLFSTGNIVFGEAIP